MKTGLYKILPLIFLFSLSLKAQTDTTAIRIKYVAADHVYITAGRSQGLTIGQVLTVTRDGNTIGRIRVTYASAQSSSCAIEEAQLPLAVNDLIQWQAVQKKAPVSEKKPVLKTRQRRRGNLPTRSTTLSTTRVEKNLRGHIGLQYYHFQERETDTRFIQPALRLKVSAADLAGTGINLEVKARSRMNRRQYRFSEKPETEWRNRLYTLSLSNAASSTFHVQAGRVHSRHFSGAGYIDGLQIRQRLGQYFHIGAFGGIQPQWQFSEETPTFNKYGAFISYEQRTEDNRRLNCTLAAVGSYQGSTINREYAYWQMSYSPGPRWHFFQSLEVDINRDWRLDRSGNALSVSGFYFSASGRISQKLSLHLSADNRQNYYTHAWISRADSLFDDAFRRGFRASVHLRLNRYWRLSMNSGIRKTEGETRLTRSNSGTLMLRNKPWGGFLLTLRHALLDNPYTSGQYSVLRFGQSMRGGHGIYIDSGLNRYRYRLWDQVKTSQWARMELQLALSRTLWLNVSGEADWGDDITGYRFIADLNLKL